MSNHLISTVYKRQLGSHMRKSVMALLADKASDDGSGIWASKQTLADELCCSKQTVIATVQAFIADGLLAERGTRKCATGATIEYGINVEALEALPLVPCHATKQSKALTGQAAQPVKLTKARGQAAGPKPFEPSVLPKKDKPSLGKRATRIPANFAPVMSGKTASVVAGWPPGRLEDELEHFHDHHTAKGTHSYDWQASWRTWVKNSKRWEPRDGRGRNGNADHRGSTVAAADAVIAEIRAARADATTV